MNGHAMTRARKLAVRILITLATIAVLAVTGHFLIRAVIALHTG